jgi:soluble lytic murein transglycosylase-like protein
MSTAVVLALVAGSSAQGTTTVLAAGGIGRPGHQPVPPAEMMPLFRQASASHGVPLALLLAVGAQESSFHADARSGPVLWA